MPLLRPRMLLLWVALSAGLLALGSKLSLVSSLGSDVPYMDEWNAVGTQLLVPSAHHELGAANFLAPQNEHRVVLSRLLSYGLIRANGQWDGLLEMGVNAVLHAALLAALVVFTRRFLTGFRFTFAVLLASLLFILAFDWENTLQGFQSQFFLLEWAALASILGCVPAPPLSPRWWLGWLAALLGLGTMSSGFLAPLSVAGILFLQALASRRLGWRRASAAALLLILCVVGLATIVPVPGHEVLRAHTPLEWLLAACRALSWPQTKLPFLFLVLQFPLAALLWTRLRERRLAGYEAALLALGLWAWLQVAALAYGRANQGMIQSPRYSDLYAVSCFANAVALGILWRPGASGRAWALVSVLWSAAFLCGLSSAQARARSYYLSDFSRLKTLERVHVRRFLSSGDRSALTLAPTHELPFPMAEGLADLLSEQAVRRVLPTSIRPPIRMEPEGDSSGFTVSWDPATGERTWTATRGPARFVSGPFPVAVLPFLRIGVRGSADLDDSALRLEPADGGAPASARRLQERSWRIRELSVPGSSSAHLVAELPPGDHWIAFTEPTEVGRLSWFTHWVLRRSAYLEAAAGVLFALGLTALLLADLRMPTPGEQGDAP